MPANHAQWEHKNNWYKFEGSTSRFQHHPNNAQGGNQEPLSPIVTCTLAQGGHSFPCDYIPNIHCHRVETKSTLGKSWK